MSGLEIEIFKEHSLVSKGIETFLNRAVLPFTDEKLKEPYLDQFPTASKNFSICLEGLLGLTFRHPIKMLPFLKGINNWGTTYFKAQRKSLEGDCYLVYTQTDHKIPFIKEKDVVYIYMIAQLSYVVGEVANILPYNDMKIAVNSFIELNRIGTETYNSCPTVMPRYTDHDRFLLKIVQKIDRPLNCCPSLHIAYSILLYNIGKKVAGLPRRNPKAWESVETTAIEMFNSVLYTKQHSLADVAMGVEAAKMAFEKYYKGVKFDNLLHLFPKMQKDNPQIPYHEIERIHGLVDDLRTGKRDTLARIVKAYLEKNNYPLVKPEDIESGNLSRYWD
ncbi:MAG: hypothetical protein Q8Q01_03180 [archaeon]|nr:hypothetical protein [archaeon]